jgi:hypothetical protein
VSTWWNLANGHRPLRRGIVAVEILAEVLFRSRGTESCLHSHRVGRKIFAAPERQDG